MLRWRDHMSERSNMTSKPDTIVDKLSFNSSLPLTNNYILHRISHVHSTSVYLLSRSIKLPLSPQPYLNPSKSPSEHKQMLPHHRSSPHTRPAALPSAHKLFPKPLRKVFLMILYHTRKSAEYPQIKEPSSRLVASLRLALT